MDKKIFDQIFGGEIRPGETTEEAAERILAETKEKLAKLEELVESEKPACEEST